MMMTIIIIIIWWWWWWWIKAWPFSAIWPRDNSTVKRFAVPFPGSNCHLPFPPRTTCPFPFPWEPFIGVDLAGILRGTHGERRRWVDAEWGGVWWGCPLSSRLGGPGERRELPGRAPAENGFWLFWRPQNAPFCIYMTKIWGDNLH